MNKIIQVYNCKCNPNFNYRTKSTYRQHLQSKRHKIYDQNINKVEDRLKIQQLEIEIKKLNSEVKLWKEKYLELDLIRTEQIDFLS